jgi:hypothetical protein
MLNSGVLGAALMIGFSFTGYIPLAIVGLGFLTIQSVGLKADNLTVLNVVSIVGFLFQIFSK